jgi:hypothetical protein
VPLCEQQSGDEVAAEDEEDLDSEEPTRYPRQPGVVEEHGDDRERAQPIETRQIG